MASKTKLDKPLLKGLEPLTNLAHDKLGELVSKATIEDLPAGRVLFREGEKDNRTLYLINGQVEFHRNGDKKARVIKSRNAEARKPLDNHQPHTGTARAKGPITVVSIDSALLEIILNDTPLDAYEFEVTEISDEDTTDWMLRFLQSRAFLKLPTENIQAILMRMEELPAKKGEVILRQGDKDDYYYIVQSGSCAVSRHPAPRADEIPLATLHEGDGFGEEALITNGRRNASVTMQEDGVLMRLKKEDFLTYLAEPLITRYSESDTAAKLDSGALLIDVRSHEEFNHQHVDGSVNIPLSMLRPKLEGLNPEREYILASADGTQSAAAAFLLTQHGFQCGILDGGLQAASFQLTGSNKTTGAAATAAPASKRTAAAEKTRQAAEDRARKISQEADTARQEAEQLAQKTASAEQAKNLAEQEIQRLSAERQDKQTEQAAREKAEQARRQAEAELRKVQAAKQANEEKQQALDESLKRAKQIAAEASQAAERSRQQAEKEAEAIRRKAREEAEQLKQEMEATRRRFEQQSSQAEQEKEAQRQAAIEQARKEAESIRQQAQSEAERLRTELESARRSVNQRAAKVEQAERQKQVSLLEQARARAMELAEKTTRIAEQEAEEIRRKALEEAEQLRQEMEQTRQQVMEHASRAREEAKRQTESKQSAEQQARRDAEARAKQAEQQARRDAQARAEEEARQQAARQETEARARQAAEEQNRQREREARRQQAIRNAKMQRQEHARRMAEEIKAKLEQAEQQRQNEEDRQRGEGLSVARATIKRENGRVILEGEEDIFIFKEPSVTPEQIEAELANERHSRGNASKNELPSFEIEEAEKPVFKPVNTQAVRARLAEQQANQQQQRKKRHTFALAATLLLALGSGGVYVFLHPELLNEHLIARSEPGKSATTKASVAPINNREEKNSDEEKEQNGQKHENNMQAGLRERFENLLEEWKAIVSP
ncbi:MAG: cyclic nucleotide-binding domain-containing protein [Thiohalophilus sp.]